jgi:hypothetical protein
MTGVLPLAQRGPELEVGAEERPDWGRAWRRTAGFVLARPLLLARTDRAASLHGAFHLEGKAAYDAAIEGPGFAGSPELEVVR